MANERWILKNLLIFLGGDRISINANDVSFPTKRESQEVSGFEDPAKISAKGTYANQCNVAGIGTRSELHLLKRLSEDPGSLAVTMFVESNVALPLVSQAPIGSAAVFFSGRVMTFGNTGARGTAKKWNGSLEGDNYMFLTGKVLYNGVGSAPLGPGTATGTPLNVGGLIAGTVLGGTLHVLDPPGLAGTTPTVIGTLESDVDGTFATPVTRGTFETATTPRGLFLLLDGDLDPAPADIYWRLKLVVAGTGAQATVAGAIGIMPKVA